MQVMKPGLTGRALRGKRVPWLAGLLLLALAGAAPAATPVIRIPVARPGVYSVPYDYLKLLLNLAGPLPTNQLHLRNRGVEVAIEVQDGNDGQFGPGDSFLFYGVPVTAADPEFQYTDKNAYLLSVDAGTPVRMATWTSDTLGAPETSFRDTQHFEMNWYYWQTMPSGGTVDHWFWGAAFRNDGQPLTLPIMLADPFGTGNPTLRVRLYGQTAVAASPNHDHDSVVTFNGTQLPDQTWDGQTAKLLTFDAAASQVQASGNSIVIAEKNVPGVASDSVLLDWIEIDYDRAFKANGEQLAFTLKDKLQYTVDVTGFTVSGIHVFNITDPANPSVLAAPNVSAGVGGYQISFADSPGAGPSRYIAVSDSAIIGAAPVVDNLSQNLRSAANGADYIIVTDSSLKAASQALADYRAAQGYRVDLVTTQEIYDQFSDGLFTPEAIRDFLKYAQQNWIKPAPKFVVLIGDANLDYHDYLRSGQPTLVPTFMVDTSVGQTTSDAHFVQLTDGDPLPKMLIGRIPAKTPAQVTQVVQRIIGYETDKSAAEWKSRVMMASGDQDPRFRQYAEEWLALVPSTWRKVDLPLADYPPSNKQAAAAAFDNVLTNLGAGLVSYFGHGSPDGWVASSNVSLITSARVKPPAKFTGMPIFVGFNCLNSLFAEPAEGETLRLPDGSSLTNAVPLAEALLFSPEAAAIAVWSPSALAYPSEQHSIGREFFRAVFEQKVKTLGEATTGALVNAYQSNGISTENFDVFTLIGDPATRIALVEPGASSTPAASGASGGGAGGSGGGGEFLWPTLILGVWLGARRLAPR